MDGYVVDVAAAAQGPPSTPPGSGVVDYEWVQLGVEYYRLDLKAAL